MPRKKKEQNSKDKPAEKNKAKEEKIESADKEEQVELDENSLESIAEQPAQEIEEDNFSEFMISTGTEMPTPTLEVSQFASTPTTEENLEEIGRRAPTPATEEQVKEVDYVTTYNEPSYTLGTNEETLIKGAEERGMRTRTFEELRNVQPRVLIEDWRGGGESIERHGRDDLREYIVAEPETRQEDRRLPFEKMSSEYRVLKRKRAA